MIPIPFRIRTARLALRCWEPTDAAALCAAIAMSLDHLRVWVPWAMQEPIPLREKVKQILKWTKQVKLRADAMFPTDIEKICLWHYEFAIDLAHKDAKITV